MTLYFIVSYIIWLFFVVNIFTYIATVIEKKEKRISVVPKIWFSIVSLNMCVYPLTFPNVSLVLSPYHQVISFLLNWGAFPSFKAPHPESLHSFLQKISPFKHPNLVASQNEIRTEIVEMCGNWQEKHGKIIENLGEHNRKSNGGCSVNKKKSRKTTLTGTRVLD